MNELRCSNSKCPSRVHEEGVEHTPFFNLSVTVYANYEVAENIRKVPVEQFECGHCGAVAEEAPDEEEE